MTHPMTPTTEELREQNTMRARLHARRETFRIAVPGSDEEYAAWLSGFDEASDIALASQEREAKLVEALEVFAKCADELDYDDKATGRETPDDEWAKFRLLASDYRKARHALAAYRAQTEDQVDGE